MKIPRLIDAAVSTFSAPREQVRIRRLQRSNYSDISQLKEDLETFQMILRGYFITLTLLAVGATKTMYVQLFVNTRAEAFTQSWPLKLALFVICLWVSVTTYLLSATRAINLCMQENGGTSLTDILEKLNRTGFVVNIEIIVICVIVIAHFWIT